MTLQMEKNKELRTAWEFVENTGKSVFLTGKAGTGKTTFLKTLQKHSRKRMVVVAPTGVAAINAGGVTIHSFFQLPLSPYVPGARFDSKFAYSSEKRKIIRTMDLLLIDEISMVRCDVLDAVDTVMRRFREHNKPFGGVQLVMIGDLRQLTPVVTDDEWALLSQHYASPYFFSSNALKLLDYVTIELQRVYRQEDEKFITILNHVRDGNATAEDMQTLNSRYIPTFRPKPEEGYIRLTTHNRIADNYNASELSALTAKAFTFDAEIDRDFPAINYPTDQHLTLKVGAQVMFLKNEPNGLYYNGLIGHVTYVDQGQILVKVPDKEKAIDVQEVVWENTKYRLNEQSRQIEAEVVGTFKQYPLRLAWAITIHKSQGLTFSHAIIDARLSFASGQVYVALSRCRSLEGMILSSPITPSAIINDARVSDYVASQEERTQQSVNRLDDLKEEYRRQLLVELFSFGHLIEAESRLDRVMQEFFYAKTPLTELHHSALADLRKTLLPIASKWTSVINGMPAEQLHSDDFLSRMKRSAAYFAGAITDILDETIEKTQHLTTDNKVVNKRLDAAYTEVREALTAKRLTLEAITTNGFTPQGYLKSRQEAILAAMDATDKGSMRGKKVKARGQNRKNSATKELHKDTASRQKQPKPDTRKATLDLYKQGKNITQIATERNLTEGTVFNHLAWYVLRGQLPQTAILSQRHFDIISRIISNVGATATIAQIKALCPAEITWNEIRYVISRMKKR